MKNEFTCQGCGRKEAGSLEADGDFPPDGWVYLGTVSVENNKGLKLLIYICPDCADKWPMI